MARVCPENTVHVENRVRFIIGLELRLELASKMISGTLKYLPNVGVQMIPGTWRIELDLK